MRHRLIALVAVLTACASAAPPPGGPEDKEPPKLVRITPDTSAVNVREKVVTFQFDETINDRGTGPQEVGAYFLVSPSDGEPNISWHRSRIEVRPRGQFRPNTAYTVTMLPGLTDLHTNKMKTGAQVVFSTGPVIPPYYINGIAFDWAGERPAPFAYMEALTPDSVRYLAQTDSIGKFTIGPLVQGTYLVRAIIDANSNRALDRNELFDSLRVAVPLPGPIELLAAARDTLPARISTVERTDSVTLTVTFDRVLDPAQTIDVSAFRLVAADSSVVPITRVSTPRGLKLEQDSAAKVSADSARRADSVAGKKLVPLPVPGPPPAVGGKPAPAPPPKPSRPPPFPTVTLRVGRALGNNQDFRLSVKGLRSLSGFTQPSERRFTTPKPPPPPPPRKDSTAAKPSARADSTTVAPPTRPPGTPPPR